MFYVNLKTTVLYVFLPFKGNHVENSGYLG